MGVTTKKKTLDAIIAPVRSRWPLIRASMTVALTLLVITRLVAWGGVARPGPLLGLGVAVFAAMVCALGLLIWWLYLSPLPRPLPPTVAPRWFGGTAALVLTLVLVLATIYILTARPPTI